MPLPAGLFKIKTMYALIQFNKTHQRYITIITDKYTVNGNIYTTGKGIIYIDNILNNENISNIKNIFDKIEKINPYCLIDPIIIEI